MCYRFSSQPGIIGRWCKLVEPSGRSSSHRGYALEGDNGTTSPFLPVFFVSWLWGKQLCPTMCFPSWRVPSPEAQRQWDGTNDHELKPPKLGAEIKLFSLPSSPTPTPVVLEIKPCASRMLREWSATKLQCQPPTLSLYKVIDYLRYLLQ